MDRRLDRHLDVDPRAIHRLTERPVCRVIRLGRLRYRQAERLQRDLVARRRRGEIDDVLLFLEHPPVITIGRAGDGGHLLASAEALAERGIEIVNCGRGGDITYHGPGQLVAYPILALRPDERDLHAYLRALEEAVICALREVGVGGHRREGLTGVWVGEAKICAIGIRVEAWVLSHGLALNMSNDLSPFGLMHPCGLRNGRVTSVAEVTGLTVSVDELTLVLSRTLGEALGRRILWAGGDN